MTEKFIKRHCEECEFCIWVEGAHSTMEMGYCGEIDEGCGRKFGDFEDMTPKDCRKGWKK